MDCDTDATVPETPAELLEEWAAIDALAAEATEPVDRDLFELPLLLPECLDDAECLTALSAVDQQVSALHALQTRLLARFGQLRYGDDGSELSEFAADELAAELSWPRWQATRRLADAQALTTRLPATLEALDAGTIDLATAEGMCRTTAHVADDTVVHEVEDRALADDPGPLTSSQIRTRARRAVLALDPQSGARHRRARAERRVTLVPQDDGMAGLWALLPAEQAVAIRDRVTALAGEAPRDDTRTADQRRADAFADLLLGVPQRRHAHVNLTMPVGTALGSDEPAELTGYGPIDADTARRLAQDATWRRILTEPVSGSVLDIGRSRYRPPAELAEHVVARDHTCVFPGCTRSAEACDLDHTIAWQDGGSTSADNLAPLCRHHHRLKHETDWRLDQPVPGGFRWTSPTGSRHHTGTHPPPRPD